MFKTIKENSTGEIVEKKSKFIANLFYIESVEEAENLIKETSKKYFDARHNCYAFSVKTDTGIVNRFSDDGEPSGTAGSPMLNIFTSQNISNILVVVTRYFGGILLGTGGLVKAYTGAVLNSLSKTEIINKDLGLECFVEVNYADLEKFKYYSKVNEINILNIEYLENVKIIFEIDKNKYENLLNNKENLNFEIIKTEKIADKFIIV